MAGGRDRGGLTTRNISLYWWLRREELADEGRGSHLTKQRRFERSIELVGHPSPDWGYYHDEELERLDRRESRKHDRRLIDNVLATLRWQERWVLWLRFGLMILTPYVRVDSQKPGLSLRAIGKILKISVERVRQVQLKAIRKCKHESRVKRLLACDASDPTFRRTAVLRSGAHEAASPLK